MPVEAISGHFDPVMGRPTKELYSMAGLILLMEMMDWTKATMDRITATLMKVFGTKMDQQRLDSAHILLQ